MSPRPRLHRLSIAVLTVALVAAACGGGDGGSTTAGPPDAASIERAAVDPAAPVEVLADGFTDAGFDLLRTQGTDDNVVFSPLSIGRALLMARGAADEPTGAAIDATFALPDGIAAHEAWNALDAAITSTNGAATALDDSPSPIVTLSGQIWPADTAEPDTEWIDLLLAQHGVVTETIDVSDAEGSRELINNWVAGQTNQLIPELLPPGFISDSTVLVLTDAVYFKAQWWDVFGKYGPVSGDFTRLDGSTVPTSYLQHLELPGPRGVGDGYVGAEVGYLGDEYSMLVLVPDEGRFDEVRERLSTDLLAEVDATFTEGPYELRMPEWETTTALDLLPWLTDAGIAPGAFPGISPDAFLSGAVHGADITVDEVGTEAAAATALGFDESAGAEAELVVAAERPFLYLVRHVESGAVLFAGQVVDPS
ncbi:MAG: serpin family protein [Actinomycetota bacterium]